MTTPKPKELDNKGADAPSSVPEFYRNEKGQLCFGSTCLTMVADETGLVFNIDPTQCDPATRDALVMAMLKGPRIHLGKREQA